MLLSSTSTVRGGIDQAATTRQQQRPRRQRRQPRVKVKALQANASTTQQPPVTPLPPAVSPSLPQPPKASTLRILQNSKQHLGNAPSRPLPRVPIAPAVTPQALPLPLSTQTINTPKVTFSNISIAKPHWLAAINARTAAEPAYASSGTAAMVRDRVLHGIPILQTLIPLTPLAPIRVQFVLILVRQVNVLQHT